MARAHFFVRGTLLGRPVGNSLWFDQANVTAGGLQATADQIGAAWLELLAPALSTNMIWDDCLVRVYDGGSPFSTVYAPEDFPFTCENAGPALPANNAMLLRKLCDGARPNRGRLYLPGMCEGHWDGDSWENTAIAFGEALGDAIMSFSDTTWVLARPNHLANTATLFNPITNVLVPGYAGSQRGRRF